VRRRNVSWQPHALRSGLPTIPPIPVSVVEVVKAPVVEEIIVPVPAVEVAILAPPVVEEKEEEEKVSVPMPPPVTPQAANYVPPHKRASSNSRSLPPARVEKVVVLAPRVDETVSVSMPPQAATYVPPFKKASAKAEPLPAPAQPVAKWPLPRGQAPKPVLTQTQAARPWGPASTQTKGQWQVVPGPTRKAVPAPKVSVHDRDAIQLLQQQKNADGYARWEDAVYTDEFDILGPLSLYPTTPAAAPCSTPPATAQSTPEPTSEQEPMPSLRDEDHHDDDPPRGRVVRLRPYVPFVPECYR